LTELAEADPRIVLLTGDLGFRALEPFADRFPDRFFNVGVAEQNMVGIATGLAESGRIPFVYSIATFASLRCYEQFRNGPALHRLPVRVVGVGGGFEYGTAGPSHHAMEDIGVMRLLPGVTVLAPADGSQTESVLRSTWDLAAPIYYRIGKNDRAKVPGLAGRFDIDRCERVRDGSDVLFLVMGSVAPRVVEAASILSTENVTAAVDVVSTLAPAPVADLVQRMAEFPTVVTVEAHSVNGGLGSLVAETVSEHALHCRVVRCGVRESPDGRSGGEEYYLARHGLSPEALAATAKGALARSRA
jgi:transketolase